jgi:hypothetical protein
MALLSHFPCLQQFPKFFFRQTGLLNNVFHQASFDVFTMFGDAGCSTRE